MRVRRIASPRAVFSVFDKKKRKEKKEQDTINGFSWRKVVASLFPFCLITKGILKKKHRFFALYLSLQNALRLFFCEIRLDLLKNYLGQD